MMQPPLVEVAGLNVAALDSVTAEPLPILRNVDLVVRAGQAVGLTGQSGGGKSTLALALAGLLPNSAIVSARRWRLMGREVLSAGQTISGRQLARRLRRIAGRRMFLINQDARASLVPYQTVGWHLRAAGAAAGPADVDRLLTRLELLPAHDFARRLPQQMSTGQCQRVQLAMAHELVRRISRPESPFLLLADEPLASVDQELVGKLAGWLRKDVDDGNALLLISHQLDLLRQTTDEVQVVCDGTIVEGGPPAKVLNAATAEHAHTRLLMNLEGCGSYRQLVALAAATRPDAPGTPLLTTRAVAKTLGRRRMIFPDLELEAGCRHGILGPSGCGKTTFARVLMGLLVNDAGAVERFGASASEHPLPIGQLRELWKRLQWVPQDTDLAFDPGATLGETLAVACQAHNPRLGWRAAWILAGQMLLAFHLPARLLSNPPGRLSGGQRKRAAIARGLASLGWLQSPAPAGKSRVLILDEPTVGVDVFLQGVVAAALLAAQEELGLTYLVISHDRRFVERFCDRKQSFDAT